MPPTIIQEFLIDEIQKTFRAIYVESLGSMVTIKNKDKETIIEFCETKGNICVDYTSRYSNTRKKLKTVNRPARYSSTFSFDELNSLCGWRRPRIKSVVYQIADPGFIAILMKDFGTHIRKNQPRGTRTLYTQSAKERHHGG